MSIKDISLIGMFGAILVASQVALSFLPNVELVTLLIIIFTLILKKKTLYVIGIFIIIEGMIFGFGLWWINYLYIWFVLYLIVRIFHKEKSPIIYSLIAGFYGLFYGALCAIPYFFMGLSGGTIGSGLQFAFSYWISGIPFDIVHGISNFFVTLILFKPLYYIVNRFCGDYFYNEIQNS
jgi:energy-coupling factor transport system substrate-specific component